MTKTVISGIKGIAAALNQTPKYVKRLIVDGAPIKVLKERGPGHRRPLEGVRYVAVMEDVWEWLSADGVPPSVLRARALRRVISADTTEVRSWLQRVLDNPHVERRIAERLEALEEKRRRIA